MFLVFHFGVLTFFKACITEFLKKVFLRLCDPDCGRCVASSSNLEKPFKDIEIGMREKPAIFCCNHLLQRDIFFSAFSLFLVRVGGLTEALMPMLLS